MNTQMSIDSIISEQIQAQSTIAVNRTMGITIRPLIKDIFDNELSKQLDDSVENYLSDIDWSDHISTGSVEDAVSLHLENNVDIDSLVEGAVTERVDSRLWEAVNDAVNDLDTDNIVSDRRIEQAVDAAVSSLISDRRVELAVDASVANYMSENLSNYFRSSEGEKVLSDFITSYAGRGALARTFTAMLLERSNA